MKQGIEPQPLVYNASGLSTTAQLLCAFVVRMQQIWGFSRYGPFDLDAFPPTLCMYFLSALVMV